MTQCLLCQEDGVILSAYLCAGLARKEDFPFITYYCPHCQALNKPRNSDEGMSALNSQKMEFQTTDVVAAVRNTLDSAGDSLVTHESPVDSSLDTNNIPADSPNEIEELPERPDLGEKAS